MDIRKLQRTIIDALEDVKAVDIQVFNTSHLTELFDRVILATGNSNRQTKALATSVRDAVKQAGGEVLSVEGMETGEWVLVDCADAVVHILQPVLRQYYKLEEVWGDKPVRVKLGSVQKGLAKAEEPAEAPEPAKKVAAKKAVAKKIAAKKVATKKTATSKTSVRPAAKTAKKTATQTAVAKPASARKTAVRKASDS